MNERSVKIPPPNQSAISEMRVGDVRVFRGYSGSSDQSVNAVHPNRAVYSVITKAKNSRKNPHLSKARWRVNVCLCVWDTVNTERLAFVERLEDDE